MGENGKNFLRCPWYWPIKMPTTGRLPRFSLCLWKLEYLKIKNLMLHVFMKGLGSASLELGFLHWHGVPACPQILPPWCMLYWLNCFLVDFLDIHRSNQAMIHEIRRARADLFFDCLFLVINLIDLLVMLHFCFVFIMFSFSYFGNLFQD